MNDDELFAREMGKVQPIRRQEKVAAEKPKQRRVADSIVSKRVRSAAAIQPGTSLSVQATGDPWVFVADGVSHERLRRLAGGRPPASMTFDLHGARRDEALELLEHGFGEAVSAGARVLCIIHGRGLHSPGKPVLKEAVYHWLRRGAFAHAVLAVIPQPGSGGGACLVLLRRKPG